MVALIFPPPRIVVFRISKVHFFIYFLTSAGQLNTLPSVAAPIVDPIFAILRLPLWSSEVLSTVQLFPVPLASLSRFLTGSAYVFWFG